MDAFVNAITELVKAILSAPVANVLILVGLVFLGLAILGKAQGKFELDKNGRIAATVLGAVLVIIGLIIYLYQSTRPPETPSVTPTSLPSTTLTPTVIAQPCAFPVAAFAAQSWTRQLEASLGCPQEAEHAIPMIMQPFEHGMMFYRDDEKQIYVMFTNKTWKSFADTWNAALPADSCPSVSVRSGFVKPIRGFGKVWCEQTEVRDRLGAATAPESSAVYQGLVQRFAQGLMFTGAQAGQVYVLFSDGKWE